MKIQKIMQHKEQYKNLLTTILATSAITLAPLNVVNAQNNLTTEIPKDTVELSIQDNVETKAIEQMSEEEVWAELGNISKEFSEKVEDKAEKSNNKLVAFLKILGAAIMFVSLSLLAAWEPKNKNGTKS